MAEDGVIPAIYSNLCETETGNYARRTELNVRDSDATLILSHGRLTGGSKLTIRLAPAHGKPVLHIDFLRSSIDDAVAQTRRWLVSSDCRTLNIAGPRASKDKLIYEKAKMFLTNLFD